MTTPNRPPADRDLREHATRRAELLALLDEADGLDIGDERPVLPRRGVFARYRLPLLAAASVAALVTGIAVALPDGDARSGHTPPAGPTNPPPPATGSPAPMVKPLVLPATMVPVPAGRDMPEALAREFVYRCVLTVPNSEGRAQTALAATFRPYFAVRTPRAGRPDSYFAIAVDDRARYVKCGGDAGPDSIPSPESGPTEDTAWTSGPVEYLGGGSESSQGRWTLEHWGRYTGAVTRITMDFGRGERDVVMAGGFWYGTSSNSRAGESEPSDDARIRGYDTSGALVWDSAKDSRRKGRSGCLRTPDGGIIGYVAPNPNGPPDTASCTPAVPWTAGEPSRP
ncbi:hypothetical protein [Embleya sp. AB8]|uniref:hypothetical protein n=1 Tax=Embleya sp. AB8 TaxID=3156304 RepID=UPI003C75FF5B